MHHPSRFSMRTAVIPLHNLVRRLVPAVLLWLVLGSLAACSGGGGGGGGGSPSVVAAPDSYSTGIGQTSLTVSSPGVLTNDTGTGLTAEMVSGPAHAATFTLSPDGSFNYVHDSSSVTTDSFTYRVTNGSDTSSPATVSITITPPVAATDTYSITAPGNTLMTSAGTGVLANDTGTGLVAELLSSPAHYSSFTLNADGSFTYVNDGSAAPTDSFTYRAKVGAIYSNTVTVTININQPPVASNVCPVIQDNSGSFSITLPASDPNGSVVGASYTIDSLPTNGTIMGCSSVPCPVSYNVTYVPTPNSTGRRGMDRFTFHVTDSDGLASAPATAWVLNNGKVRIMPLGDSITDGININNSPAPANRVGYRKDLYDGLTALSAGTYGIDFVGSVSSGSALMSDTNHEGHDGWCDDNNPYCTVSSGANIADSVSGFLSSNPPDIILLHIGTNEFSTDNTGVNTILNNINTWAQSNYAVTVMVARIIPTTDGSLNVEAFNNLVAGIANDRPFVKVFMVDEQTALDDPNNADPNFADPNLMTAGGVLHPNATGYTAMAIKWQADLVTDNVLPSCP